MKPEKKKRGNVVIEKDTDLCSCCFKRYIAKRKKAAKTYF